MGPQTYVTAVASNDEYRPTPPDTFGGGLFNAVTSFLPLTQFDRIRVVAEVVSGTPDLQVCLGMQMSRDGVEIQETFSLLQFNADADVAGPNEWLRTPWLPVTSGGGNSDYVRVGLMAFTRNTSPLVRQVGAVRFRIEFKMGT